jgi:hypothetical protein
VPVLSRRLAWVVLGVVLVALFVAGLVVLLGLLNAGS